MQKCLYTVLLLGGLCRAAALAAAVDLEIVPKVGFAFHTPHDLAGPRYDRLHMESNPVVGFSLGYLTPESGQVEVSWTHTNTTAHLDQSAGNAADVFDIGIDHVHFNGLYMTQSGEFQPFALLGVGVTRYSSQQHSDHTRFSFAAGGGMKWLWNDHLGLRLEGKWIPMWAPKGTHLFCPDSGTGGCPSTDANSYFGRQFPFIQTFEFTTGLLLRY